jgi:hypothetical protein
VYVIATVPAVTPVTIPVPDPTVAIPLLLLLQVPPVVASLSVIWEPAITVLLPEIAPGVGFTVTIVVEEHVPIV